MYLPRTYVNHGALSSAAQAAIYRASNEGRKTQHICNLKDNEGATKLVSCEALACLPEPINLLELSSLHRCEIATFTIHSSTRATPVKKNEGQTLKCVAYKNRPNKEVG